MKKFKKIMALAIAMVMVLAMSVTAFADNYKITITSPSGHTYQVYQVFTGEVDATDSTKLNSLKYGENTSKTKGADVSQPDMETLAGLSGTDLQGTQGQALIAALSDFVNFNSTPITTITSGTASTELAPGYYVIRDTVGTDGKVVTPDGEGATLYMFKVLNKDLQISAKSDKPSSVKHVDDVNDAVASDRSELKDSADYDIGDEVPYTLTFTLPSDYANYEHYYVKFYDDMSKGLTYKAGSSEIKYGGGNAASFADPAAGTTKYNGGHMWTWEIMDLKSEAAAANLSAGDVITLTYKAILNADAVIGSAGNPNKMYVEFSNNPNNTGDGTSKPGDTEETPEDINIVFTYQAVFNKVDEDDNPLTGADFTLYKKVGNSWVDVTTINTSANHPKKDGTSAGSTFTFKGLDAGEYKLEETTVPTGYNPIDAIEFTINADHELESDNPLLNSLTASGGLTIVGDSASGKLETDIENKSGAVLPSTGGIGTTIFYVVGAILAVGAGILLVTRRRMSAQ